MPRCWDPVFFGQNTWRRRALAPQRTNNVCIPAVCTTAYTYSERLERLKFTTDRAILPPFGSLAGPIGAAAEPKMEALEPLGSAGLVLLEI